MAMRSLVRIGALIAALLPAACMGGARAPSDSDSVGSWVTSNFMPASEHRHPRRSSPDLVIADLDNSVLVYTANVNQKNPPLLQKITQGVSRSNAVYVDRLGILYVLNFGGSGTNITEYKRGSTTPFKTITKGLEYPGAIVVDRSENLYVTVSTQNGEFIAVYAKGASSPTRMIQVPTQGRFVAAGLAFGLKGALLVDTFDDESNVTIVYSIARHSSNAQNLNLQNPPGPSLGTDKAGNIYLGNHEGSIAIYPPGSTSSSRTINLNEDGFYTGMAVTKNGTIYWPNYDEQSMYEIAPGADGATNVFSIEANGSDAAVGSW